jgi:hypothetical protein
MPTPYAQPSKVMIVQSGVSLKEKGGKVVVGRTSVTHSMSKIEYSKYIKDLKEKEKDTKTLSN